MKFIYKFHHDTPVKYRKKGGQKTFLWIEMKFIYKSHHDTPVKYRKKSGL